MKSNNYAELQDEKCFGCKFCVWDENEKREVLRLKVAGIIANTLNLNRW